MTLLSTFSRPCAALMLVSAVLAGCSTSDLVAVDPPAGFSSAPDPSAFDNERGALELYRGVLNKFREATSGRITPGGYIVMSGLISDELNAGLTNTATAGAFTSMSVVDGRSMTPGDPDEGGYDNVWRELQGVRMQAMNAIPALRKYGQKQPKDYAGHAFALWGMSEVMLANFFCSGIPLTTVEFQGSFSYEPGSTSQQVYEDAIAKFDSAMANAPDSTDVVNLAKVGKGWALLNLGKFDEAAQAVADVPTDFVYKNFHSTAIKNSTGTPNFTSALSADDIGDMGTISDREGGTGLPYRSSNDPRTLSQKVVDANPLSGKAEVFKPSRWMVNGGDTPVIMASGVEARLIEAEAALRRDDPSWLTTLNALRTSGSFNTSAPDSTGAVDTTWAVGDGAVLFTSIGAPITGLRPLQDPGSADARVDLLFEERAYWLFLTGRRHSDLRRLIRQYGRSETDVFPQGPYPAGPVGSYGTDVNAPAPADEVLYNPQFKGCFDRQA